MKRTNPLVIAFLTVWILPISVSHGAEKVVRDDAVATIKKFLDLDLKGVRLSGHTLHKIKPYVAWNFSGQPGWDRAISVISYKVSSYKITGNKAAISILYELDPSGQEMKSFELEKRDSKWLIVWPKTFMPYVLAELGVGSYRDDPSANQSKDDKIILNRINEYIKVSTVYEGKKSNYLKTLADYMTWPPSINEKDAVLIKGYRISYIRDLSSPENDRHVNVKVRYYGSGLVKKGKYIKKSTVIDVNYKMRKVDGAWKIYDSNSRRLSKVNGVPRFYKLDSKQLFLFGNTSKIVESDSYINKLEKNDLNMYDIVGYLYFDRFLDLEKEKIKGFLVRRTKDDLKLIRNAIFARYGYKFKTAWLEDYFKYNMVYSVSDNQNIPLSKLDRRNIKYLLKIEKEIRTD